MFGRQGGLGDAQIDLRQAVDDAHFRFSLRSYFATPSCAAFRLVRGRLTNLCSSRFTVVAHPEKAVHTLQVRGHGWQRLAARASSTAYGVAGSPPHGSTTDGQSIDIEATQ